MSRYHSWLNTATDIIRQYKGEQPLAAYLRTFFSSNKKYGSNDRRQIAQMCYCYYRLGKLAVNCSLPIHELIVIGLLLCTAEENNLLQTLKPEWSAFLNKSSDVKLQLVNQYFEEHNISFAARDIFPWRDLLSEGMEFEAFCYSFLVQPNVFIRIRPGFEKQVRQKLQKAGVLFLDTDADNCIAFNNLIKIEDVIVLNKEAVIQDYSSQHVFSIAKQIPRCKLNVWDSCAASGGKSILASDVFGQMNLTVSDIRPSILANLRKRLAVAGISIQQLLQLDLTESSVLSSLALSPFDLVICDVPCSGSGTWSRTPESVYFFEQQQLDRYQLLQKKIALNVVSQVKPGGYMFYITCSVFKMENEMIVEYLLKNAPVELIDMKLLAGYNNKADTMFAALVRRK